MARRFLFDVDARDLILQNQQAYFALQEKAELEQDYKHLYDSVSDLLEAGLPAGAHHGHLAQLLTQRLALLNLRIRAHDQVIQAADALAQVLALREEIQSSLARAYRSGRGDGTRVVQTTGALRDAAETYRGAVRRHNDAIAGLYRHSARWPEGTLPLLSGAYPPLPDGTAPPSPPDSPAPSAPAAPVEVIRNGPF
jgi:hypothetical protein